MTSTSRTFDILKHSQTTTNGDAPNTVPIRIGEPDLKRQHLGLSTWGSSLILAQRLHLIDIPSLSSASTENIVSGNVVSKDSNEATHFDILELGAGTGLVGLSAAALWRKNVLLTDLPDVVSNLAANIELNGAVLRDAGATVAAGSLDWANPSDLQLYGAQAQTRPRLGSAEIVLAADTVYSEDHPTALSATMCAWLRRTAGARLCIAYPLRPAYLDYVREFWAALEQGGLECLEEGKSEVDESWDDERLHEWSVWRWKSEVLDVEQ